MEKQYLIFSNVTEFDKVNKKIATDSQIIFFIKVKAYNYRQRFSEILLIIFSSRWEHCCKLHRT